MVLVSRRVHGWAELRCTLCFGLAALPHAPLPLSRLLLKFALGHRSTPTTPAQCTALVLSMHASALRRGGVGASAVACLFARRAGSSATSVRPSAVRRCLPPSPPQSGSSPLTSLAAASAAAAAAACRCPSRLGKPAHSSIVAAARAAGLHSTAAPCVAASSTPLSSSSPSSSASAAPGQRPRARRDHASSSSSPSSSSSSRPRSAHRRSSFSSRRPPRRTLEQRLDDEQTLWEAPFEPDQLTRLFGKMHINWSPRAHAHSRHPRCLLSPLLPSSGPLLTNRTYHLQPLRLQPIARAWSPGASEERMREWERKAKRRKTNKEHEEEEQREVTKEARSKAGERSRNPWRENGQGRARHVRFSSRATMLASFLSRFFLLLVPAFTRTLFLLSPPLLLPSFFLFLFFVLFRALLFCSRLLALRCAGH